MTSLNEQIEGLERVFKTRAMDHAGKREMYSAQPMLRDGRAVLNKTRVFGRSHWLNTAYHVCHGLLTYIIDDAYTLQFSEMQEFFGHRASDGSSDPEIRSLRLEIEQLFNQCKFTAQVRKMSRPSRCFPPVTVVVAAPLREEAEQMGQLYFARLESSFRILHSPSYWVEHKQYYDNPESGSLTSLLKIQLVTAIGMGLQEEYASNAQKRVAALQWTLPAQSWVSGLLEKNRLSVDGFQVQCLLILARQILAIGGDLIWIGAGTLLRTAMQMGLHRDPKHFPQMAPVQAEVRRRLWATVLELTVQSSLDSGMPPMISADDYDTGYPMDVDDDQIEIESTTCNNQDKVATNTSIQIILLKAIPVRLKILRSANGLCTEMFYDEVLAMSAELGGFRGQCLALSQRKPDRNSGLIKTDMPALLLTRFLLTLNASFAMRARTNQVFRGTLKTYLSSALDILSPDVSPDLKHLLVIGGGIFKNCVNNAALVVSNQMIAMEEAVKRGDIVGEDAVSEGHLLKTSLNNAISLVERRLRSGETNVKMFCTLHMALGHVTALRGGISVPLEIARHAKFALEKALGILMAQQDSEFSVTELSDRWMSMSENTFIDDASWTYPVDFTSTLDVLC